MTKSTITRERATDKEIQMLVDSHENGTAMFMRTDAYYFMAKELQECRKAEAAWRKFQGMLNPGDPAASQQPATVVPEEMPCGGAADDYHDGYQDGWNAFRAAMLQPLHTIKAASALGSLPKTGEVLHANSPVIPDTWIPVSERIPENKPGSYEYLVFEKLNNRVNHDYWNVPDAGDDTFTPFWNHYGEYVTHWMPLPAAPQEVRTSNVIDAYQGADGKDHPIINLSGPLQEVK